MARSDRPLTDEEREEIQDCVDRARKWFGDGAEAASPDRIQHWIDETVDALQSKLGEATEAGWTQTALDLGCLWGQAVCDRLGWEWAAITLEPGWESYGIVTPSRSHAIFPLHYMQKLLSDPERDQTSLLLYNMLKAGNLPAAHPGEYLLLG